LSSDVLVLAYNRPEHLMRLLDSLAHNVHASNTRVIISIDGPKALSDLDEVQRCAQIATVDFGFLETRVIQNQFNLGLAKAVINAIDQCFIENETLIILEDDLVLSEYFLDFMNRGLEKYRDEKRVASIQGYQYPEVKLKDEPVFLRGADCWGWATWRDRWRETDFDVSYLLGQFDTAELIHEFDFDGAKANYDMLKDVKSGKVNSWAIRWHASNFLQNKLSLFPQMSLVQNLGSDGSGINSGNNDIYRTELSAFPIENFPNRVAESDEFRSQLINLFRKIYPRSNSLEILRLRFRWVLDRVFKLQ